MATVLPYLDFIIPLVTVALVVLLKYSSRREKNQEFEKDDYAIGFELMATALMLLGAKGIALIHQLESQAPQTITELSARLLEWIGWVFLLIFAILILPVIVRKRGWKWEKEKSRWSLTWKWGIILPDVVGMLFLLVAFLWNR